MRVAFVATSYPTHAGDAAGHFVRAEALAAAREGSDVHVVAPAPLATDAGVVSHPAGGAALFSWPGAAARARESPVRVLAAGPFVVNAARTLRALAPARIVAHWIVPSAIPIALACPAAALDVVAHGADVRLLLALPPRGRRGVVRALVARASRVRFVATSLRDALASSLPPELRASLLARSAVVPPSVDVSAVAPPPPLPAPYVAVVGRLVPAKRVDLAIRAIAADRAGRALVVVGDGPARGKLAALADAVAPGRVRFLGALPRPVTLGVVRGAAALVHPSEVDAAPTAVLEARALGVPVVVCGAGDTGAWAERDAGIVLAERTAPGIAGAIARGNPG